MILSKPTKHAFYTEGDSLTETEHKDSCDINKMIADAHRGRQVRGGPQPQYGYDDTTLGPVEFRIKKEQLENELSETAKTHEFSPEELKHIHPDVQKKFKFKVKAKRDEPNNANTPDQKTSEPVAPSEPKKPSSPDPSSKDPV